MVLQAGNAGGFFLALQRTGEEYEVVPISAVTQGRLVLSKAKPQNAEIWSAAETGACTACTKPFLMETFAFDGNRFRLLSRHQTKREFAGFQDEPLIVRP
jgi:hypothetical protein